MGALIGGGGVSGRSGNAEAARKYSERLSWFSVASEKLLAIVREKAVEAARALFIPFPQIPPLTGRF